MAEAKRRKTGNAETEEVAVRLISQFLLAEERVKELTSKRELVDDVLAGAVARGVVMYPNPEAKSQAALVPITLLPTPFAADCYLQAVELGPTFHELMDKVACDLPWMRQVLHETGKMDAICGRLLGICERVYGSGGKDHCRDVRLNIMRNDFMLDTRSGLGGHPMKQIEINMMLVFCCCYF
ncbi:unnamed protein product [Polarella glacialis]|uniref:Uncharacterized protein n=1 Tax=Polarella glacialis TaxID=89957 RepID=A0A813GCT0_POLGL|nr:unnamed protein product [Polarella glacialis]